MKILMPYFKYYGIGIDSEIVTGGLEKFSRHIYHNFTVIPVEYDRRDRHKRFVTKKIVAAVHQHKPDVIITNDDMPTTHTNVMRQVDTPYIWIVHNSAYGHINILQKVKNMHEFVDHGGTLCMVSKPQAETWNKLSKRVCDKELIVTNIVAPAFCTGKEEFVRDTEYDAVTIARLAPEKDPFWLSRKTNDFNFKTRVFTNLKVEKSRNEYYEKNKHWPNTIYNTPYDDLMKELAKSRYYVQTSPVESWGITVLEALARGVKPILICNNSDLNHTSEVIPAKKSHYHKLKTTSKPQALAEILSTTISEDERREIYDMTQNKHSKDAWIESVERLLSVTTPSTYPITNSLEGFFE